VNPLIRGEVRLGFHTASITRFLNNVSGRGGEGEGPQEGCEYPDDSAFGRGVSRLIRKQKVIRLSISQQINEKTKSD
jgi:hypothetical protein